MRTTGAEFLEQARYVDGRVKIGHASLGDYIPAPVTSAAFVTYDHIDGPPKLMEGRYAGSGGESPDKAATRHELDDPAGTWVLSSKGYRVDPESLTKPANELIVPGRTANMWAKPHNLCTSIVTSTLFRIATARKPRIVYSTPRIQLIRGRRLTDRFKKLTDPRIERAAAALQSSPAWRRYADATYILRQRRKRGSPHF